MDNLALSITTNLEILGLKRGADAKQVRAAFRRLARTYHPDVAVSGGAAKFQQIAEAYSALKNLSDTELGAQKKREFFFSFFAKWKRVRTERANERVRARNEKIDFAISVASKKINLVLEKHEREKKMREVRAICLRLMASHPDVRRLAKRQAERHLDEPLVARTLREMSQKYQCVLQ